MFNKSHLTHKICTLPQNPLLLHQTKQNYKPQNIKVMNNITYRTIVSANAQINIVFAMVQKTIFANDLYNKVRNELLQELLFTQDYTTEYLNVDYNLNNEEADDLGRRCRILLNYADYIQDSDIKGDGNGSQSKCLEYALRHLCHTLQTAVMCFRRFDY